MNGLVRYATAAIALPIYLVGGVAQSAPLCQRYAAPPLGAKVDLFADPMPTFDTGQVLPSFGAFAITLKPAKKVVYPYKSPNDHDAGMGAVLAIEFVPAAAYRIGLSASAQLDVVQENIRLPIKEVQADQTCPGIERSFDVQTSAGPLVLQVSGASVELLKVLITPLPIDGATAPSSISTVSAQ